MSDTWFCPRRTGEPGVYKYSDADVDHWRTGGGLVTQTAELSCSYCGSLSPDTFMQWVRDGWQVGPTDKNYKVYISKNNTRRAKFYFQHLSVDQRVEFVQLMNGNHVTFGPPGHFYVTPFFVEMMYDTDGQDQTGGGGNQQ